MEKIRKPFQGVLNIIRFNWHFYVLAIALLPGLLILITYTPPAFHLYFLLLFFLAAATITVSLLVSLYVYDLSGLYKLNWLKGTADKIKIVNINAGFDETSDLLQIKFKNAELVVFDFYDPEKHTEVSIKRARKAYPPFTGTKTITTSALPLENNSADKIFVTLAAHEIRNNNERIAFFKELHRALKPKGQIFVTEHLRDTVNFLAYNIGFFHFLSKQNWHTTFRLSNMAIIAEQKITPFITTFILEKNGTPA